MGTNGGVFVFYIPRRVFDGSERRKTLEHEAGGWFSCQANGKAGGEKFKAVVKMNARGYNIRSAECVFVSCTHTKSI